MREYYVLWKLWSSRCFCEEVFFSSSSFWLIKGLGRASFVNVQNFLLFLSVYKTRKRERLQSFLRFAFRLLSSVSSSSSSSSFSSSASSSASF